jgi:GGDEF domain-containing protein
MHVRLKLSIKLACVFGAVCASLLFLVASIALVFTTESIRNEAFKRLEGDAEVTLRLFDNYSQVALASARMFAQHPKVIRFSAEGGDDPEAIRDLLPLLEKGQIFKVYDSVGRLLWQQGFVPANSVMVADIPSTRVQLVLAGDDDEQYEQSVERMADDSLALIRIVPIRRGQTIVGAVVVGRRLDAAFVKELKDLSGVEVAIARANSREVVWLAKTVGSTQVQLLDPGVERQVVDAVRFASKETLRKPVSVDGQQFLAAFAALRGEQFQGVLFMGESAAPLNARILQTQIFIIGLCVLAGILAFLAARLVSRTITEPIRKLADHSTEIARGNLEDRIDLKTGDELEQLAEAFNAMTESLKIMKFNDQNANPLTKLPGNLVIETEVKRRLEMGEPLAVLYIDLDNFKAFNDKFGFEAGDRILQFTAEVMKDTVAFMDQPGDFVGHIGGDDFIVVTNPDASERLCREIIRRFDADMPYFYPEEDRNRGYIISVDRQGQVQRFGLCSISIAVVTNESRRIEDFLALSSLAAEVKKVAKGIEGSSFARDRRAERATPTSKLAY